MIFKSNFAYAVIFEKILKCRFCTDQCKVGVKVLVSRQEVKQTITLRSYVLFWSNHSIHNVIAKVKPMRRTNAQVLILKERIWITWDIASRGREPFCLAEDFVFHPIRISLRAPRAWHLGASCFFWMILDLYINLYTYTLKVFPFERHRAFHTVYWRTLENAGYRLVGYKSSC